MTLLCLILAGGKSIRMEQDKALMFDTVNSLSQELIGRGYDVIVACGNEKRTRLFTADCWLDPLETSSLAEVVRVFIQENDAEIQLFPCDMYRLDSHAIDDLLNQPPGVPTDANGQDQFTLARIPRGCKLPRSKSMKGLFSQFDRNDMHHLGAKLENFNFPNQIDDLNKSDQ